METLNSRCLVSVLFTGVLFLPLDSAAQGDSSAADKTLSPYFFVEGGDPAIDRLPLKDTRVDVAIAGVIADVTVRQVYENHGTRPIHIRYVFPASTRAAVHGMTMTVGNVRTVAKIKERERAARIRSGQERGQERSLLEQNVPTCSSSSPTCCRRHVRRRAQIHRALVPPMACEFVYPTVVGPSTPRNATARRRRRTSSSRLRTRDRAKRHRASSTCPACVDRRAAPGAPVSIASGRDPRDGPGALEVTLDDEERRSGNRDFILRYRWLARRSPRACCSIRDRMRTSSC